jgi:hypothetical protein
MLRVRPYSGSPDQGLLEVCDIAWVKINKLWSI